MAINRTARQSAVINGVYIVSSASVAGKKEAEGFFGSYYDMVIPDALFGKNSFEAAERQLFTDSVKLAVKKAGLLTEDIDLLTGGDLLNQIVSAGYSARDVSLPFLGLYGACSTIAESLIIGSMAISGGFIKNAVCAASSHFGSAERQFRSPLELGTPKPPTAQNTVTASGAFLLSEAPSDTGRVRISRCTIGIPMDFGISDANDMGAAMAPAAASTICTHMENFSASPADYDLILTGDLGTFGSKLAVEMCLECGCDISGIHKDCGSMVYPSAGVGGSGCGCGASALAAYFVPMLKNGKLKRILFAATGAMHSPLTVQQSETIPGIAHAVEIINEGV